MVSGSFVDGDKPVIRAVIASNSGLSVQTPIFILDTGFTGDLVVPEIIADQLGITRDMVMKVKVPGRPGFQARAGTAIAFMEGVQLLVTVCVVEGWPLLGISFMEKFSYKAEIDCKNKTVCLKAVS